MTNPSFIPVRNPMGLLGLLTEHGWVVTDSGVSVPKADTLQSLLPSCIMDSYMTFIHRHVYGVLFLP